MITHEVSSPEVWRAAPWISGTPTNCSAEQGTRINCLELLLTWPNSFALVTLSSREPASIQERSRPSSSTPDTRTFWLPEEQKERCAHSSTASSQSPALERTDLLVRSFTSMMSTISITHSASEMPQLAQTTSSAWIGTRRLPTSWSPEAAQAS